MSRNSKLYPYEFKIISDQFHGDYDETLWDESVMFYQWMQNSDKLSAKFKQELNEQFGKGGWIHRSNVFHRIAFKEKKHYALMQLKYGK